MNKINFYLFIFMLLGMVNSVYAEVSIDAQLRAIQAAPASKRVELMNQFKQRLAEMNAQERAEVITKMRSQIQKQQSEHKSEMQEHQKSRQEQIQHSEKMQRMEQIQQHQRGKEYMNKEMNQQIGEHQGGNFQMLEMKNGAQ